MSKDAPSVYDTIWQEFAKDREKNRSIAYANLQRNLAIHAAELVPDYMTAKEHVSIIGEIEQYTKGDAAGERGDPRDIVSGWLRGEMELSRVPLEKTTDIQ